MSDVLYIVALHPSFSTSPTERGLPQIWVEISDIHEVDDGRAIVLVDLRRCIELSVMACAHNHYSFMVAAAIMKSVSNQQRFSFPWPMVNRTINATSYSLLCWSTGSPALRLDAWFYSSATNLGLPPKPRE